ncbi:hypothetical protein BH09BAC5_BH09BAC5_21250 [soil metagenome]
MRFIFLLLLFPFLLSAQQIHTLFLGNSYTYTNNMPSILQSLALERGDSINWDSNTPGGYTFQNHTQDANSISKINSRQWNFVILQGQSQEPSLDTPYVATNVFPYAHQLDSLIQQNDSCTQTIFFMTWGRKNGDASNCVAYPPVCTFAGMEQQLRNRYVQMGNDNHAMVAPVGEAWKNAIATNPAYDLYLSDESHPSIYGSYLTACVFYATIFRQSPLGINFNAGIPPADAAFLQNIAGQTVLDSMQLWNTTIYHPDPGFTFSLNTPTSIDVVNSDTTATSWYWNTGTGYVQGTPNQTLNFPSVSTYTVCLAVSNDCLSDTSCQTINLATLGTIENNAGSFIIQPNPSNGNFTINFKENHSEVCLISIYDSGGKLIRQYEKKDASDLFEIKQLPSGIFMLTIDSQNHHFSETILVQSN